MKVMVLVKANPDSEAGKMPSPELFRAMAAFNEHLVEAGVLLAGEGLHPTLKGKRVLCSGKERTVVDGPFDSKDLVSGFWLWQVRSMQDALDWVRRSPFEDGEIEVRPVYEARDFGEALPADVAAKEDELRSRARSLH
jgi:hypothetical protein